MSFIVFDSLDIAPGVSFYNKLWAKDLSFVFLKVLNIQESTYL